MLSLPCQFFIWYGFGPALIQRILISFKTILEKNNHLQLARYQRLASRNAYCCRILSAAHLQVGSRGASIPGQLFWQRAQCLLSRNKNNLNIFQYNLISDGLKPILSHTEKLCIVSYLRQSSTNYNYKHVYQFGSPS